ncbi:hypothetical protein KC19_1G023800 [Ceratodon purpureus]|uniref:Uncharacterized protein n=1 Tax=Ceratodon purpureus TaxID=3225 RepID=A0A8T0J2Z1_CERPU|nr:hypothetical protein KC19_1G023800 [Ceratodon purpureus]
MLWYLVWTLESLVKLLLKFHKILDVQIAPVLLKSFEVDWFLLEVFFLEIDTLHKFAGELPAEVDASTRRPHGWSREPARGTHSMISSLLEYQGFLTPGLSRPVAFNRGDSYESGILQCCDV